MYKFAINLVCCFVPCRKTRHKIRKKYLGDKKEKGPSKWLNTSWAGRYSYVGNNFLRANPDTKIGAFCSFGRNVTIGPSQHPTNWLSSSPIQYVDFLAIDKEKIISYAGAAPVNIGNDVWIGNNVTVQDGLTVGDGAIIGSNAVVTHDVPPYAIVAGVPARILRYRFTPEIIKDLLDLKWWDLPDEYIANLPFDDVEKCIVTLKKLRKEINF